jgi:YVTN family beta-propeller protein
MRTRIRRAVCVAAAAGTLTALVVAGAGAAGTASTAPRARPAHPVTAYVANQGSDTVTPVDTATNTALKAIKVGPDPRGIAQQPTMPMVRQARRMATGHARHWRTAEILILRHQLAVLQRRQPRRPKLNWADRALLAALLGVIPKTRRHGLRLLVIPDTIVRWQRGKTGRPLARTSRPWPSGWPVSSSRSYAGSGRVSSSRSCVRSGRVSSSRSCVRSG